MPILLSRNIPIIFLGLETHFPYLFQRYHHSLPLGKSWTWIPSTALGNLSVLSWYSHLYSLKSISLSFSSTSIIPSMTLRYRPKNSQGRRLPTGKTQFFPERKSTSETCLAVCGKKNWEENYEQFSFSLFY